MIYEVSFYWRGVRRTDYVRANSEAQAAMMIQDRYPGSFIADIPEAHSDPSA